MPPIVTRFVASCRPPCTLATAVAAVALAPSALAQSAAADWQTFNAADHNLTFHYPAGWQVSEETGAWRITASDGSRYLLRRDWLQPAPSGDPATNAALRSTAETIVKPLLSEPSYAGVRLVDITGGAGAIYRFRGKGSKSGYDLAEVWFAVIGAHNVVLEPGAAPLPDHFYELSTLFKSLAFADTPPTGGANRPASRQNPPAKSASPGSAAAGAASTTTPATTASRGEAYASSENEKYEGHFVPEDMGFSLRINHGPTASAVWSQSQGTATYNGTYTGQDGTYVVHLTRAGGPPTAPQALHFALKGSGGMESGAYWTSTLPTRRAIADIRLVQVDAGNHHLHPMSLAGSGGNPYANRRAQQYRPRMPRMPRNFRIINPNRPHTP